MDALTDRKYSDHHLWVKPNPEDEGHYHVGITNFAQYSLGSIAYISLPSIGDSFKKGDVIATIESVKAAIDALCPISGVVNNINEDLFYSPHMLNNDPYGTWMIDMKNCQGVEHLLTAAEYDSITNLYQTVNNID